MDQIGGKEGERDEENWAEIEQRKILWYHLLLSERRKNDRERYRKREVNRGIREKSGRLGGGEMDCCSEMFVNHSWQEEGEREVGRLAGIKSGKRATKREIN